MTPTAPPRPADSVVLPAYQQVQNLSFADHRSVVSTPPPGYHPNGYLIVQLYNDPRLWMIDPLTGEMHPDGGILPTCLSNASCYTSFDQNWIQWQYEGDLVLSRTGGTDRRVLFDEKEGPVWPSQLQWVGLHTLEYTYAGYLPEIRRGQVTLIQAVDPEFDILPAPREPLPSFRVNQLDTEIMAAQPSNGSLVVVRTAYNAGHSTGHKYYIYDRDTGLADFFARLPMGDLTLEWHPLGEALYYRYPDAPDWYLFDPLTHEHRHLGDLPSGLWSRDGVFRVDWIGNPLSDPYAGERLEAGLPLFKLVIWNSHTGLIRRYTIPDSGDGALQGSLFWSPDNRYLAFVTRLPEDSDLSPVHTLVLDTETGSVTELGSDALQIIAWVDRVPER
jgi:hypothetical protein